LLKKFLQSPNRSLPVILWVERCKDIVLLHTVVEAAGDAVEGWSATDLRPQGIENGCAVCVTQGDVCLRFLLAGHAVPPLKFGSSLGRVMPSLSNARTTARRKPRCTAH